MAPTTKKPLEKGSRALRPAARAKPRAPRGGPKFERRIAGGTRQQRLVASAPNTRRRVKKAEAGFEVATCVGDEVDRQLAAEAEAASGW